MHRVSEAMPYANSKRQRSRSRFPAAGHRLDQLFKLKAGEVCPVGLGTGRPRRFPVFALSHSVESLSAERPGKGLFQSVTNI